MSAAPHRGSAMRRALPCAHCGTSITRREDLVTRVVNLNFAYFCSEHCANKLKLPGLAPTPHPARVQPVGGGGHETDTATPLVVAASELRATPFADGNIVVAREEHAEPPEHSEPRPLSERARTMLACAFVALGLFGRSAAWHEWASAAALCAFLLVVLPFTRACARIGLPADSAEHVGAYTLALALWAYVAAVFSAAWWVCGAALAVFAWIAFGLRTRPALPRWLGLFGHGEWKPL